MTGQDRGKDPRSQLYRRDPARELYFAQSHSLYGLGLYGPPYAFSTYPGYTASDRPRKRVADASRAPGKLYHQQEVQLARGPFNSRAFNAYSDWLARELEIESYRVEVTDSARSFSEHSTEAATDRLQVSGTTPKDVRVMFSGRAGALSALLRYVDPGDDRPRTYVRLEGDSNMQVGSFASLLAGAVESGAIYGAFPSSFRIYDPTVTQSPIALDTRSGPKRGRQIGIGFGITAIAALGVYLLLDSWRIALGTAVLAVIAQFGGAWLYDLFRQRH